MIGPPRGTSVRKSRSDEIRITKSEAQGVPLSSAPVYSSFKTKQGHFPGYGPQNAPSKQQTKPAQEQKAPGPGDYEKPYSSFKKAEPLKGKTQVGTAKCTFGSVPRKDEWIGDQRSPGVGQYETKAAQPHRKDFRNPSAPPLMQGSTEPRTVAGTKQVAKPGGKAPGPADYAHQYSSFSKATGGGPRVANKEGKVSSTFGNSFDRSGWRQESEAPGPCAYDIHDPRKEDLAQKKSFRSPSAPAFMAGTSKDRDGRPITGEVKAVGVVATQPATTAGPGDYQAPSDFDVSRRTFNAYCRQQAAQKEEATVPRGDLPRTGSRTGSLSGSQRGGSIRRKGSSLSASSSGRQRSSSRKREEHADPMAEAAAGDE
eukprot:TRINITY_DN531_c0_g2_i1.p1 TRINITY_DN531_c0_g2~~TRINITY_DN531_c0_g2_i1.p1  ORF type:complete len:406 (+),score=127.95 TRINITY_DN531_c0_g2_i1:110-1219(+)